MIRYLFDAYKNIDFRMIRVLRFRSINFVIGNIRSWDFGVPYLLPFLKKDTVGKFAFCGDDRIVAARE